MFSGPIDPHLDADHPVTDVSPLNPSKSYSLLFGTLGAIVVIAGLLLVFGVRFTSDYMAYDSAKETTIIGTVTGTAEYACPGADGELERHVTLKTNDGQYEIHLAASRILRSVGWQFKEGDSLQVLGAKVKYQNRGGLIARQITMGNSVFTFRGPGGVLLLKQ